MFSVATLRARRGCTQTVPVFDAQGQYSLCETSMQVSFDKTHALGVRILTLFVRCAERFVMSRFA